MHNTALQLLRTHLSCHLLVAQLELLELAQDLVACDLLLFAQVRRRASGWRDKAASTSADAGDAAELARRRLSGRIGRAERNPDEPTDLGCPQSL